MYSKELVMLWLSEKLDVSFEERTTVRSKSIVEILFVSDIKIQEILVSQCVCPVCPPSQPAFQDSAILPQQCRGVRGSVHLWLLLVAARR